MSPRLSIEQVDALLEAWDDRLRRMDDNLVALEGESIYQRLAGKAGRRPPLEGISAARLGPALDAVSDLFEDRRRLGAVVDRARAVRASISAIAFWGSDDKVAEIQALLDAPSIAVASLVVPLGDRGLLDEGSREVFIEPERLLAEMTPRFAAAREALLAAARAMSAVEADHAALAAEIDAVRRLAAEVDPTRSTLPDHAEIAALEADLGRLHARALRDPLGAEGMARKDLGPRLAALARRLSAAADLRRRVTAALAEARDLRRRLADDHARSVALRARALRELRGESVDGLPQPLDEGLVLGFETWLHKLEQTVASDRWGPAEVGLARFRDAARRERAAARALLDAAASLLACPADVEGRLEARRAQAAALAARGLALPAGAAAAALTAAALLSRRPIPVDDLNRAFTSFEAAVIALAASRRS